VKIEELAPKIILLLSGTGVETPNEHSVNMALQDAIVKFMEDTGVFTDELELEGQDCVTEYILDLPECRRLVAPDVRHVTVNGCPARCWRDGHHDVLVFDCAPPEGACIVVPYSWKIQRDDCDIPEAIYEDYLEPVRDYTLWLLHSDFFSPAVSRVRAQEAYMRYNERIADIKARKDFSFSRSRPRMRNPYRRGRRY